MLCVSHFSNVISTMKKENITYTFCSTHTIEHLAKYMIKLNYIQLSDIVIGSIIIKLTCKFSFMCLLILLNNFLLVTYLSFVGIFFKGHHTFITHLNIFPWYLLSFFSSRIVNIVNGYTQGTHHTMLNKITFPWERNYIYPRIFFNFMQSHTLWKH